MPTPPSPSDPDSDASLVEPVETVSPQAPLVEPAFPQAPLVEPVESAPARTPVRRRHRRVTTPPPPGSDPEPASEPERHTLTENDERLRLEKPPHY